MKREIIEKIFAKHLEHDMFFDKRMLNVDNTSQEESLNTIPNKVIRIIFLEKYINPSKIGKVIGIGKSTVTATIDSLEEKGMVLRKNDPNDKRRQWISLTEKGERYHAKLIKNLTEKVAKVSEKHGMKNEDLEEYYVHLTKMVDILGKSLR